MIGGGIAGAHRQFLPAIVDEMNGTYRAPRWRTVSAAGAARIQPGRCAVQLEAFLKGETKELTVPGSSRKVKFDGLQRTGRGHLAPGDQRSDGHWRVCFRAEESRRKDIAMRRILLLSLMAWPAIEAQQYTLGVGVYPGDPRENFAPVARADQTYRNLALHRPVYQSSSYDYNLTAQLITDGIKETKLPRWVAVSIERAGRTTQERAGMAAGSQLADRREPEGHWRMGTD